MQRLEFAEDSVVFRQGEITHELYVVEKGVVDIYRNYASDSERLLAQLGVGKSFAETAIVSDRPRSVTAVAEAGAVLAVYAREEFSQLQQDYPDMALDIISELSQRLRNTTDRFMEACRAIAESMNEKELKNNKGLRARLKKFAAMYDEACKEEYREDIGENAAKAVSGYNSYGTSIIKR